MSSLLDVQVLRLSALGLLLLPGSHQSKTPLLGFIEFECIETTSYTVPWFVANKAEPPGFLPPGGSSIPSRLICYDLRYRYRNNKNRLGLSLILRN